MEDTRKVDVILLCGGQGARFLPITHGKIPKPLYKLEGMELINYSLKSLDFSLVNKLIFAVDYYAKDLVEWVNEQEFPCKVVVSTQQEHGVLKAVQSAVRFVETKSFIVCNTDEVREGLCMQDLLEEHNKTLYLGTLSTAYSKHLHHRRVVNKDKNGVVLSTEYHNNIYRLKQEEIKEVNIGFAQFDLMAVDYFDETYGRDWDGMIEPLVKEGLMGVCVMPRVVYFNIGTASELRLANTYFTNKKAKSVVV